MFPRDIVCLRNISVDTLHKGDTEDNDDDDDDDDNNNNNNSATYQESAILRNCKNSHIWHCTHTTEVLM